MFYFGRMFYQLSSLRNRNFCFTSSSFEISFEFILSSRF